MPLSLTAVTAGENAIMCYLPKPVRDDYPLILNHLSTIARQSGATDVVPAYNSLLVVFDKKTQTAPSLIKRLQTALTLTKQTAKPPNRQRLMRIPVCYEGKFAPDLAELAQTAKLETAEVIAKHSAPTYRVACLGFIPGFAFLGYVDDAIAIPRRANPRPQVVAGSIGIAGRQTGAYPADSPGGWNIIGRTPKRLYAPEQGLISCFEIGDSVEFYAISTTEFTSWREND